MDAETIRLAASPLPTIRRAFGSPEVLNMKTTLTATVLALSIIACAPQLLAQTNTPTGAAGQPQTALSAAPTSTNTTAPPPDNPAPELVISGGDLLEITIYGTDFNRQVRVSGSGEISMPMLGKLKIAGLRPAEAEKLVGTRLEQGGFFNDPQVTIVHKEYSTQGISVLGEVQKPGIYPLLGSRTLLEAISAAGGTTVKAGNEVTIIHRANRNQPQRLDLSHPVDSNVGVAPGDTIVVSKAGIVYVVGDVRQPSGVVMDNSGRTVLQAIAMAQGTNPTAALDDAIRCEINPRGARRKKAGDTGAVEKDSRQQGRGYGTPA